MILHTKFKQLYLIGYSNLDGDCNDKVVNTWHNVRRECAYYKDNYNNNNIQILS